MSTLEEQQELRGLVLDVLGELGGATVAEAPGAVAWERLADSELTLVGVPEECGGSGGSLDDAASVLAATAAAGLSVPLAETAWLAGWLASTAGRAVAPSPATALVADPRLDARPTDAGVLVTGTVRVPWRHEATELHLLLPDLRRVAVVPLGAAADHDALGVPSDTLTFDGTEVEAYAVGMPTDDAVQAFRLRHALARTQQIAGACRSVRDLAVAYATQREQFGRSLSRNQVVQHYLARVASRTHGVVNSAGAALEAFQGDDPVAAARSVVAAKAVASGSVEEVTRLAHQVFGAIGTTREHVLHRRTMSLWAWRDDAGDEFAHARTLVGDLAGSADLWELLEPVLEVGSGSTGAAS